MNWPILLIALIFSVLTGAAIHGTLARRRPQWSEWRRKLQAALALPAALLFCAVLGILWELVRAPGPGENMQGLAIAAIAFLGLLYSLIAIAGGFIGAALDRRRREP